MRRVLAGLILVGGVAPLAQAQTHVVKKPETVVRAVGVYEWTGDESKPTASRLVPVSIFINGKLDDAGIYLARPVPFALEGGTIFEAQKAGVPEGTIQLAYQLHVEPDTVTHFDAGWSGYGPLKLKPQEPVIAARKSGPLPRVVASGGSKPHFSNTPDASTSATKKPETDRSGAAGAGTTVSADKAPDDPNRPTMRKRDDSSSTASSGTPDNATVASDDPDRPTLIRRPGSSDADSTPAKPADDSKTSPSTPTTASDDSNRPSMRRRTDSSDDSSGNSSADDPDRPTLKKRTPADIKSTAKQKDQAGVRSVGGSLNDDPDRPQLHRGAAIGIDERTLPPLTGLPPDMHQMVAVSDAKDRAEHDFKREWESDNERAQILSRMQEIARTKLAAYGDVVVPPTTTLTPVTPASASRARKKAATPAPEPLPVVLANETLNGYTLSYGGAATFVYTATSPGAAGTTRYVAVVTQQEPLGGLETALTNVTDSKHLDRTPWMRLVDVVDAEASNRASLVFELRAQTTRQFALYRVIGAQAEQTFATAVPQ